MDRNSHKCLNCGKKSTEGDFCPYCGQRKDVSRITMTVLSISLLSGLTRINRGFLYTCWKLLLQPWNVIKDYLQGKRQQYTGPIQILIILCFLSVVVSSMMGDSSATKVPAIPSIGDDKYFGNLLLKVIQWYLSTPILQYLTIFIPAVPVFMLITTDKGKHKYNLAECIIAAIYTSASSIVFRLITSPLQSILGEDRSLLTMLYLLTISFIGIFKSLKHLNVPQSSVYIRLASFYGLTALNYLLIIVCLTVLISVTIIKQ